MGQTTTERNPSLAKERDTNATRALLAAGVIAGPIFIVSALLQITTRDGFDLGRHAVSLLGLGDLGWIQIATFIVTGLLTVGCAGGLWHVLHPGRAGTWGPLLVCGYGVGYLAAGVFLTDPANGFPAGAPDGMPDDLSWHGIVHAGAALTAFLCGIAAGFVIARRFWASGNRRWSTYSLVTAVVQLPLFLWPSQDSAGVRLLIGAVLSWVWLSVVAARLLREALGQDARPRLVLETKP